MNRDPILIKDVVEEATFKRIQKEVDDLCKSLDISYWNVERGRTQFSNLHPLNILHQELLPLVKEKIGKEDISPTYYILSVYEGKQANLHKHKDDDACQYTLNLSIYHKTLWPIWVSGKEYKLQENEALIYLGNDQMHWRNEFPDPDKNVVAAVSFFYCDHDHWYFTEGPEYRDVIRKRITIDEWNERKNNV